MKSRTLKPKNVIISYRQSTDGGKYKNADPSTHRRHEPLLVARKTLTKSSLVFHTSPHTGDMNLI